MYRYYNYYDYDYEAPVEVGASAFGFFAIFALILMVYYGILLVSYIMESYALYTLANRRGIRNPWLAWVPVAGLWTFGELADNYDYFKGNLHRGWRKILLILSIVCSVGLFTAYFALIAFTIIMAITGQEASIGLGAIAGFIVCYAVMLVIVMLSWALMGLCVICLFKIYESTVPQKALKYTLISIVVPFGLPILLLKCCKQGYDVHDLMNMPCNQMPGNNIAATDINNSNT